jgi:hypothetical protein
MLSISDYEECPEATAQFIRWPKHLTHFRFGSFYNNGFYFDLPMLHDMLLPHKTTLKVIDIGYLSRQGTARFTHFRACDFPALEVLRLSRRQMALDLAFTPEQEEALLGEGNFKIFGWDFSIYDQHNEDWTEFGAAEENWLRDFAKAAIRRKTPLSKIEIQFDPDDPSWTYSDAEIATFVYPWDRMDKVRDEIRPAGITLVYSDPTYPRGGIRAQLDAAEEEAEGEHNDAHDAAAIEEDYPQYSDHDAQALQEPEVGMRDIREYFPRVSHPHRERSSLDLPQD